MDGARSLCRWNNAHTGALAFMFGRGDEPEPPEQDDMVAAIAEFPWLA